MKIFICMVLLSCSPVLAQEWESFFEVESIKLPNQRWVPNSLGVHSDKQIAFCTNRGEVWIGDYRNGVDSMVWQRFASGLHSPKAIQTHAEGLSVLQNISTWTLLKDMNGDGVADLYEDHKITEPQPVTSSVASPFSSFSWLPAKQSEPFKGQFIGYSQEDSYLSRMIKVETADNQYYSKLILQDGFRFPIDGLIELPDQSYIVNLTNRSDLVRTRLRAELQRLVWKLELPSFEIEKLTANSERFAVSFTEPLNQDTALASWSYSIQRTDNQEPAAIKKLTINPKNPKEVFIYIDKPIVSDRYYQITCDAVWSVNRNPVRNATALFIWKQIKTAKGKGKN